jgi:hypothetical protein
MEITIHDNEIIISGHIKTIEDYLEIKKAVSSMLDEGKNSIVIKLPETPVITSALIGFFLKLIYEEKVKLTIYVKNEKLFDMLTVLNLVNIFNVKKF